MPESIINPKISPLSETIDDLMILDAPKHENDAANDAEHKSVCKVFVHRKFYKIPSQSQLTSGGDKSRENPPKKLRIIRYQKSISKINNIVFGKKEIYTRMGNQY